MCYNLCTSSDYVFFGTQYRVECWCGDENTNVELNGGPAIAVCDDQCAGNTEQICGGTDALSAYEIHEPPVADGVVIGETFLRHQHVEITCSRNYLIRIRVCFG